MTRRKVPKKGSYAAAESESRFMESSNERFQYCNLGGSHAPHVMQWPQNGEYPFFGCGGGMKRKLDDGTYEVLDRDEG